MLLDFLSLSFHCELLYTLLLCQSLQHFGPELFLEILFFLFLLGLQLELLCQRVLEHDLEHFTFLLLLLIFLSLLGFALELIVLQSHLLKLVLLLLSLHFNIP